MSHDESFTYPAAWRSQQDGLLAGNSAIPASTRHKMSGRVE